MSLRGSSQSNKSASDNSSDPANDTSLLDFVVDKVQILERRLNIGQNLMKNIGRNKREYFVQFKKFGVNKQRQVIYSLSLLETYGNLSQQKRNLLRSYLKNLNRIQRIKNGFLKRLKRVRYITLGGLVTTLSCFLSNLIEHKQSNLWILMVILCVFWAILYATECRLT